MTNINGDNSELLNRLDALQAQVDKLEGPSNKQDLCCCHVRPLTDTSRVRRAEATPQVWVLPRQVPVQASEIIGQSSCSSKTLG